MTNRTALARLLKRTVPLVHRHAADFYRIKEGLFKDKEAAIAFAKKIGFTNFRKKCYEGFKLAQDEILRAILEIEEKARAVKQDLTDPRIDTGRRNLLTNEFNDLMYYQRVVLQEIPNVITWTLLLGEQVHVRSLLVPNMNSGFLTDRNIASVSAVAKEINRDKGRFTLIADITSTVGTCDLITVNAEKPGIEFVEVKEGKVSGKIIDLIEVSSKTSEEGFQENFLNFYREHGPKGAEQAMRIMRQMIRAQKAVDYMKTDKTVDETTGLTKRAIALTTKIVSLSPLVNAALKHFYGAQKEELFIPLDCCLVGIYRRTKDRSYFFNRMGFRHSVYHATKVPWDKCGYLSGEFEFSQYADLKIHSLRDNIFVPTHRPIFIIGVDEKFIIDVLCESIDLFLFFDGERFFEMCQEFHLSPRWSSRNNYNRERSNQSLFDFGNKHLYLKMTDDREQVIEIPVLKAPIYSIIYELQSGYSVIKRFRESLKRTLDELSRKRT